MQKSILLPDYTPQTKTTHITRAPLNTSSFPPFLNTNDPIYNRRETVTISDSESDMELDNSRDSMLIDSTDMDMNLDTSAHYEPIQNSYGLMEVDELAQGIVTYANPQNGPLTHGNAIMNSNVNEPHLFLRTQPTESLVSACETALVERSMQSLRLTAAPPPFLPAGPILTPISCVPELDVSEGRTVEANNVFSTPMSYLPEGNPTSLGFATTPPSLKRLQDKFFGRNELDDIANGIQSLCLGSPSIAAWVPPEISSPSPPLFIASEEYLASPSRSALGFDSLDFENLDFSRPDAADGPLHSTPLSDDGCPSFDGVRAESVDWDNIFSTKAEVLRGTEPCEKSTLSSRSPQKSCDSAKLEDGARVSFGTDRTFVTFSSGLLGEFLEAFNLPSVDRKQFPPNLITDTGFLLKETTNLAKFDVNSSQKISPKLSERRSVKNSPSRPLPSRHISENILSSSRRNQFHEPQDISDFELLSSPRATLSQTQATTKRNRIPRSVSANGPLFKQRTQNLSVASPAPLTLVLPRPTTTKPLPPSIPVPDAAAEPLAPPPALAPERGTLTVTQSIKNLVHHLAEAESLKSIASHLAETEKTITKVLKEQVFPGAFPGGLEEAGECAKGSASGTQNRTKRSLFSRIALLVFSW